MQRQGIILKFQELGKIAQSASLGTDIFYFEKPCATGNAVSRF